MKRGMVNKTPYPSLILFDCHCTNEVGESGTLDVRVCGNRLFPATILGRFKILFTILRNIHLLVDIHWSGELALLHPDSFFVDQLAAGLPLMRWWWPDTPILFYCHFPDLLLVSGRKRWWKRVWRVGFDWLEGLGMRSADRVVVNSSFTKGVVQSVWDGLGDVGIVYPCVDTREKAEREEEEVGDVKGKDLWKGKKVLLSINRFERKKNIELAIRAFARLSEQEREGLRLVIAGLSTLSTSRSLRKIPLNVFRWLRPPRSRKCLLPPISPHHKPHPRPPFCYRQKHRFRTLHPLLHLGPIPPLCAGAAQIHATASRAPAHLHPVQRTLRHRAPGGNARRCSCACC